MAGTRPALLAALLLLAMPAAPHAVPADTGLPPEIEKILALPEDKIDVGMAAIVFAHVLFPDHVNVASYSLQLDRLADETRLLIPFTASSDQKIAALAEVLYRREGYIYDFSPASSTKTTNYFLPAMLDKKQGTCVTLPMLFMAVAQRLGVPVYPVHAPQHTFLRNLDAAATIRNIEATSGGTKLDSSYINENHISQTAIDKGTYLRTLTYREYLADLLTFNGRALAQNHQYDEAVKYFKRAQELNPTNDFVLINIMDTYLNEAMHSPPPSPENSTPISGRYFVAAITYHNQLLDLGVDLNDYGGDPIDVKHRSFKLPPAEEANP
jgi:regulator of sirC expression with transglutaminase-like and TPR domain